MKFKGNNWNQCGNGTGAVGCGMQETFRNCADIKINSNDDQTSFLPQQSPPANAEYAPDGSGRQLVVLSELCIPNAANKNVTGMGKWCQENCLKYPPNCNSEFCECM